MFGQDLNDANLKDKRSSRFSQPKNQHESPRRAMTLAVRGAKQENADETLPESLRKYSRANPIKVQAKFHARVQANMHENLHSYPQIYTVIH